MTWGGQREAWSPDPIKLDHCAPSMARNTIIGSLHIRKESVRGVPLQEPANTGGGKSGPKMLSHGDSLISLVMLGGFLQGGLNMVFPNPSKVRK